MTVVTHHESNHPHGTVVVEPFTKLNLVESELDEENL